MKFFLVLGICLLLLLSCKGEDVGWIWFLHADFDEDEGDNYGVSNFLGMLTWRIRFSDGDVKAEIMLPSWNNFFRSLLHFIVVRSVHDEEVLVRIISPSS
jgi:hypothetical protein